MRGILLAATILAASVTAVFADDIMASRYGNTTIATDAKGVKTRIYYKSDGTFTGKQGTASFSGTWTLDAKNMLCLTFTPLPQGATNPTCVPGTAHKVGDTWGGGTVSLVAGIQ